ncbi:hydrolase [Altererythrobacter sp. B11]|uniref:HAD family hydrolase n=1 Tax=Altererythrobacter sp. B11 TaxID=2060312 RepID=UPI000DC6E2A2|nr:HAD family phosphatase [Altererythrobacter sp. B11]BBC70907.1 hydrolase [Altererythrobacter sp. B11]
MSDAGAVPIRVVVFDIGRVLIEWNLRYLFEKLIDDPEELDWFLANVVTEQWHYQHDAGRPLAAMLPERKALFPQQAALIDAYADRFLETIPGPVPGMPELVERLAQRGVPMFALTNFGVELWGRFRPTFPLLGHFGDIVVSGVEQRAKPDPAIYAIAEARFGAAPREILFTDDNPANVEAARARGWQAHLFTGAEGLERELVALGLLEAR